MGTTLAIPILLLVIFGLALGLVIQPAAAFFAIPIVAFIMINVFMVGETMTKQRRLAKLRKFRNSARAQKVDFTDEDKRTVAT